MFPEIPFKIAYKLQKFIWFFNFLFLLLIVVLLSVFISLSLHLFILINKLIEEVRAGIRIIVEVIILFVFYLAANSFYLQDWEFWILKILFNEIKVEIDFSCELDLLVKAVDFY